MIRNGDQTFDELGSAATAMGIHEVVTAPAAPWQNPYVERFSGSVRRECLDHVLVFGEHGLRRVLQAYARYYQRS
jgi:Integrase core domain